MNTIENLLKGNVLINEAVSHHLHALEDEDGNEENLDKIGAKIIGTVRIINNEIEKGTLNYLNIEENFERLIAIDLEDNPHTPKITCSKGCSFCCHIKVDSDTLEASAILKYCKDNNIDIDWDYVQKQADVNHDDLKWMRDKTLRKCVFLSEQGECRIYPARPFVCRKHFSIDDPDKCDTDKGADTFAKPFLINAELLTVALVNSNIESGSLPKMLLKAKQQGLV